MHNLSDGSAQVTSKTYFNHKNSTLDVTSTATFILLPAAAEGLTSHSVVHCSQEACPVFIRARH